MAVIDTSTVERSAGRPYLQKAVRSLRIIGMEKQISTKKYDMLVLALEICFPENEQVNGKPTKIAGLQVREYIVFHGKNTMPQEELKALVGACKAVQQVDLNNPAFLKANFIGKGIKAEVKTDANVLKQTNEAGESVPVLDEETGLPMTDNNYRLGRIVGSDDRFTIPAESVVF